MLPYNSPNSNSDTDKLFEENQKRITISGVQEKFSVLFKPIPYAGNRREQMPVNEHLNMHTAQHIYNNETAENALICF